MKLAKSIRACVTKNMPIWGQRFEESDGTHNLRHIEDQEIHGKMKNLSMGDYASCVVGEFYNFKKQACDSGSPRLYNGCTICYDFSMEFHHAETLREFHKVFKEFCQHAKNIHEEVFK